MSGKRDDGNPTSYQAFAGDGDPFPHLRAKPQGLTLNAVTPGEFLGTGEYRAQQAEGSVTLTATGGAPVNVVVKLVQSLTGLFPPMFALVFVLPDSDLLEQKSFITTAKFTAAEPVDTVRVKDADGWHEVPVEQVAGQNAGSDHGNS
ncbi:hypothetical protein [Methylobacterium gossipiicola]|uniref:hypothetical protein n=1 Tax=Methylobacterium gossipiicola TaxID=582675 RepID=UPI0011609638|nr:hypothetical protein [Methylobacterium gossipiicola]